MSQTEGVTSTSALSILPSSSQHAFTEPVKKINEGQDVAHFLISQAYSDLVTFLLQLNRAMFPCRIQVAPGQSTIKTWELDTLNVAFGKPILQLRALLEELNKIVDEVPLSVAPRRFGNVSFREWYRLVEERSSLLLRRHLPKDMNQDAIGEVQTYFLGSFGSPQRLDYGSGHELSFLAFLGCIWKLGGFGSSSTGGLERSIVIGVFEPYLQLARRLIKTYTLEPAGSHGVWGLDDHSFIPYIFGSAQNGLPVRPTDQTPLEGSLEGAPNPADVTKLAEVNRQRERNMYFGAIGFIHDVKKGPFWEHSPMLYDISGVPQGWGKINKGMIKMYNAEVLSKFPVVQHFRFGSLFSWDRDPNAVEPPTSIHASSRPGKDAAGSSSTDKATARGPPSEVTRVPWANSLNALPAPGTVDAAPWANGPTSLPSPGAGTAAPWASTRSAAPESGLPPTGFPKLDPNTRSMPPPTRAPWARPH